jgi:insulysin
MKLVIYDNKTIEELKELVIKLFSDVKNKELPKTIFDEVECYRKEDKRKLFKLLPIKNIRKLSLFFPIPFDRYNDYYSKSIGYYTHLLGHEGFYFYFFKNKKIKKKKKKMLKF